LPTGFKSREEYNNYMREYMRKKRQEHKKLKAFYEGKQVTDSAVVDAKVAAKALQSAVTVDFAGGIVELEDFRQNVTYGEEKHGRKRK